MNTLVTKNKIPKKAINNYREIARNIVSRNDETIFWKELKHLKTQSSKNNEKL